MIDLHLILGGVIEYRSQEENIIICVYSTYPATRNTYCQMQMGTCSWMYMYSGKNLKCLVGVLRIT